MHDPRLRSEQLRSTPKACSGVLTPETGAVFSGLILTFSALYDQCCFLLLIYHISSHSKINLVLGLYHKMQYISRGCCKGEMRIARVRNFMAFEEVL